MYTSLKISKHITRTALKTLPGRLVRRPYLVFRNIRTKKILIRTDSF